MRYVLTFAIVAFVLFASMAVCLAQAPGLVSYWPGDGNYEDVVGGNNGTPVGGTGFGTGRFGQAFTFDGSTGRIFVPDSQSLAITGSIAISAWVLTNGIPAGSFASQILFRGDDRNGLDPYTLDLVYDNYVDFHLCDGSYTADITGPIILGGWNFVAASEDAKSGVMSLYINGEKVAFQHTEIQPFGPLDPNSNPGVGIGNVQSANYNEYFQGSIEDVRLYNTPGPTVYPTQFFLSSNTVKGGKSVDGEIVVDDAPFQVTPVELQSDNPAVVMQPVSRIGFGQTAGHEFAIKTTPVTTTQVAHLSGSLNGVTVGATLTIEP